MARRAGLIAVLVLLAGGVPAAGQVCAEVPAVFAANERRADFAAAGARIAATLTVPRGAAPHAAALLLHGHTGTRDEFATASGEGLLARTARALAERGIATLRIDFRGSGDSGGAWADTTPGGQAADARAAFERLAVETGLRPAVIGFSQGGLVALLAFGDAPSRMVLWNPVLDPGVTFRTILGEGTVAAALRMAAAGQGDALLPQPGLRARFVADALTFDARAAARRVTVPLLVVQGTADRIAPPGDPVPGARTIRAAAGHDLGARTDLALTDRIIDCTAAFLLGR